MVRLGQGSSLSVSSSSSQGLEGDPMKVTYVAGIPLRHGNGWGWVPAGLLLLAGCQESAASNWAELWTERGLVGHVHPEL